ncbi:MAG: hypothetical protein RBU23_09310 [Candidatus Auribacterota bacterium]|jgi:hypothetical protein|nr:hypothetical protein [Candidatus Auribacterota bacterium]
MKVVLDNHSLEINVQEDTNLEQLLIAIQDQLRRQGSSKMVVDVRVDGEEVFQSQNDMSTISLDGVLTVEITTDNVLSTATKGLTAIKKQLPQLADSMSSIAGLLQEGRREEALETFSRVCNDWRKIIQFFDSLATVFQLDYNNIKVNDKTFEAINIELLKLLTDTKTAISNDDLVMLSDLVEYELAPKMNEEVQIVDQVMELIQQ